MNRILVICLSVLVFSACKKSTEGIKAVQAQGKIDDALILDYISANHLDAKKILNGTQDTTGIWYVITTQGTQATYFTNSSLLTVGYTARLLSNGKVIAQTNEFHPSYRIGDMLKGWQLGLTKSKPQLLKGGTIRLLVASRYAYGPFDQPGIPANSILDFDIELFDVTN